MFRLCTRRRRVGLFVYIQKRQGHKKKWATNRPKKMSTDLALQYFDTYYPMTYKDLWPSIRVALLSQQKYCALLNNFATDENTITDLLCNGADDIMRANTVLQQSQNDSDKYREQAMFDGRVREDSLLSVNPQINLETNHKETVASNLIEFVPSEKVYTEREVVQRANLEMSNFTQNSSEVEVIPSADISIPHHLRVFVHERGDIRRFPKPKTDKTGKLAYYLMDGASILPVIALQLEPNLSVLDLCAGPGGKSLSILQTMLTENIVCVEKVGTRLKRLKQTLKYYMPLTYTDEDNTNVQFLNMDGNKLAMNNYFDRVLVDAPCSTDRHYLHTEENNLFSYGRQSERLELIDIQKSLLCSGIRNCKPEGIIVYSTCTLSPGQNDAIVQAAIKNVLSLNNINVVVEDTSNFARTFRDVFKFYKDCLYGQLVLPSLSANFGPMYFSKLRRIA